MSFRVGYHNVQKKVFEIIRNEDRNNLAGNVFDAVIIGLIVVNIIAVILDTFTLDPLLTRILSGIEVVSVAVFTVEYLLR
ncbi:MAG: hypothetical protein ACERKO_10870, partial [Acetanaerobacterium sp.]